VRHALEDLSSVSTVRVTRAFSPTRAPLTGLVDLTYGSPFATCGNATTTSAANPEGTCGIIDGAVQACDLVLLGGVWFRARDMWTNTGGLMSQLSLGRADDCAVRDTHLGSTVANAEAYGWSGGYEWSVTFLRLPDAAAPDGGFGVAASPMSELLSAPAHDLWPREAVLHVRGGDCDGCYYLPRDATSGASSGGLSLGVEYFVRVSAANSAGSSAPSAFQSIVPNAVPGAPESASLAVVSGTALEVFWCPPGLSAGDVGEFEVQWDSSPIFKNLTANPLAGCSGATGASGSARSRGRR
jgi:hypothetical protein